MRDKNKQREVVTKKDRFCLFFRNVGFFQHFLFLCQQGGIEHATFTPTGSADLLLSPASLVT